MARKRKHSNVHTQVELAAALTRHYGQRIRIQITPQIVSGWIRGRRIPGEQTPLPPARVNLVYSVKAWIKWFDQYLLQTYAVGEREQPSEHQIVLLPELELKDKIERLQDAAKKREIEAGKWVKRDDVERAGDIIGGALNSELTQQYERIFETRMCESVTTLGLTESQSAAVVAALQAHGRNATDAIKERLADVLSKELAGL